MHPTTNKPSIKQAFQRKWAQAELLKQIGEGDNKKNSVITSMKRKTEESGPFPTKQPIPRIAYEGTGSGGFGEGALRKLLKVTLDGCSSAESEKAFSSSLTDAGPIKGGLAAPTVEDALRAVSCEGTAEYALIPIENSFAGTLHRNYELLLRYNLYIVGELEQDIKLNLLIPANTSEEGAVERIKKVIVAPDVAAHCNRFILDNALTQEYALSMEESAEKVKNSKDAFVATIGTQLIAQTYGLKPLSVDVQNNEAGVTRYLLVGKQSVTSYLSPGGLDKTSIIFCMQDEGGALYRALACFSLREIDLTKVESRRTSRDILRSMQNSKNPVDCENSLKDDPWKELEASSFRFAYSVNLDFLGSEFDARPASALAHLKEQSHFVKVLGSYPRNAQLVGPAKAAILRIAGQVGEEVSANNNGQPLDDQQEKEERLKIGIVGFGNFGQFLAKTFVKYADVYGINRSDRSAIANKMGVEFYPSYDMVRFLKNDLDVIVMCTSVISFEQMLGTLPKDQLRNTLIVDVLSVKMHPKEVMLSMLPATTGILCTHPMFGPESGKYSWQSLPFVFEKVRIPNEEKANQFLAIWEAERCKMVEMSCELHDEYTANSQFITHLMGRILGQQGLSRTPIDTKGFENVLNLVDTTCSDSFDLFYSLYKFNLNSEETLRKLRESFALVERQIAAKEAYIAARAEIAMDERQNLLEECRSIIKEAMASTTFTSDQQSLSKTMAAQEKLIQKVISENSTILNEQNSS